MTGSPDTGVVPTLDAADLIEQIPELSDVAELSSESLVRVPGASLQFGDLIALARRVNELADGGVDGFVVTQGTDTLEETSFFLHLLGLTHPVVFTGAMRNPAMPGSDGPANLLASVRVAADPQAASYRTVVVMNDQIHAARFVAKAHTSRVDAFRSPAVGPVGAVTESEVLWFAPPPSDVSIGMVEGDMPRVVILPVALGDDTSLVEAVISARPDGVVVAAMGAGHVPMVLVDPLGELAARTPVVLSSRVGEGRVFRSTYGFEGSEMDLLARGLIWGGSVSAHKARIALVVALAAGWSQDEISRLFVDLG